MNIPALLDELSFISRETVGGGFTIQHLKESGKYKVVFTSIPTQSKDKLKETTFEEAIFDAINFLKLNRKPIDVPEEKYTMFK